jgi:hypothetical protein
MKRIKRLHLILSALASVSIFFVLKTSPEPVLNIFQGTSIESLFQQYSFGNTIIYGIFNGVLVSIIFYIFVIWLPDKHKKTLIKRTFTEQYQYFKEDTISILLQACETTYYSDMSEKLTDQLAFREYFTEPVNESQSRWDAVLNGLDERLMKDILVELEILMHEIRYVLDNVNIEDQEVFAFFKRLSQAVYKMKNFAMEYEDIKRLSQFLWGVLAGYSFADGYRENDIIGDMIRDI